MPDYSLPDDYDVSGDVIRAKFQGIGDADFDLAEKVVGALFETVPIDHSIRNDPSVARFIAAIETGIGVVGKLPSMRIEGEEVVEKPGEKDLHSAEIDLVSQIEPVLRSVRDVANKLEEAGFEVYGRRMSF